MALIIGVNDYDPSSGIATLAYPDDDALLLTRTLIERGDFEPGDIVLMLSSSPDELKPTGKNIRAQLERLQQRTDLDLALIYFSGHGIAERADGVKHNYVLPYDAMVSDLGNTALGLHELIALSDDLHAKSRLLVLDACRSDPSGKRSLRSSGFQQTSYSSSGTAILFASKFGEPAFEDSRLGHGAFSYYFVQGLEGAADGWVDQQKDGAITLAEAFDYTRDHLSEIPRESEPQTPWISAIDWDRRDITLTQVHAPPAPRSCPASAKDLDGALESAIQACEVGAWHDFQRAYGEARATLSCMSVPVTPEQISTWQRVEARYELNLMDRDRATRAWRASEGAGDLGVVEVEPQPRCLPDDEIQRLAERLPVGQLPRPAPPPRGAIQVQGSPRAPLQSGVPQVIQVAWDGGLAEPPILWSPNQPIPDLRSVPAPAILTRRGSVRALAAGSGAAALAAGGLLAVGLRQENTWEAEMDRCYDEAELWTDPEACTSGTEALRMRTNLIGGGAAIAGLTAVGLGITSAVIHFRY